MNEPDESLDKAASLLGRVEQVLWLVVALQARTRGTEEPTRDLMLPEPVPEPVRGDPNPADRAFLERVEAAIAGGLANEAFGVEALALRAAVGRSHLYRRLEALKGCSPAKLILERRLERAARLLADGAGTVSEIAFQVGFKNLSHFSQRFRERYGKTPSAVLPTCRRCRSRSSRCTCLPPAAPAPSSA